ncbi:MAG TPA: MerR family transcriptional regulator [candidate division WOR-3 bacterium]|uniref:MerR family transcriptional regulator n=1 Tax=candidate division WOR-3 bacterium TaxID=2052148 RepID=A0A7V0T5E9_UNCW3|nr:MerR family transcriptional regulator [candidate division WOR-3 bacterium]
MKDEQMFSLEELCRLTGFTRRTVRYYIQLGLVDRPEGAGRGARYRPRHLEQLIAAHTWRRAGLSLERIRSLREGGDDAPLPPAAGAVEAWTRLTLAPGLELHVGASAGLSPEELRSLVRRIRALVTDECQARRRDD